MGGPGSGNWYRWARRSTTDDYQCIDVRALNRQRVLIPGLSGTLRWRHGDRQTGSIGLRVIGHGDKAIAMRFSYTFNGEEYSYLVYLTWTPCHFGGQRPWFLCSGEGCGRRVAALYGGRYFLCRHCHKLVYESTHDEPYVRHLRKTQAIRTRLGGSGSIGEPFPEKPKGMHWRTYRRLRSEADYAEYAYWEALSEWLYHRVTQLEKLIKN
jgi:hypothetical protein